MGTPPFLIFYHSPHLLSSSRWLYHSLVFYTVVNQCALNIYILAASVLLRATATPLTERDFTHLSPLHRDVFCDLPTEFQ